MDFWAGVLDMEWHEESSNVCALAVLDGTAGLFRRAEAARAQFPNSPAFRGWIAFNPKMGLSQREQYVVAVHELGHLFGLAHNSNPSSVMYFIPLEGQLFLDRADLTELACRHKLRIPRITGPLALSDPSLERQTGQSF
jgi:hypothetical protein